ncbi:MAG: DegT/DnrJ/EryC1/StrS family aminotransferase [Actinomycetia bacterium]|nr:DegT/DnrJ/EryC1/StrS family aminotransferase [Actinomycetes bacterium]
MPNSLSGIPLVDLNRQHAEIAEELNRAVLDVIVGGRYILGPEEKAFEEEMADYLGIGETVGVASGTDALSLMLRALDIGPGDEVITTPFTFIATADTISFCGAKPVFADIDPRTFNLDPESVKSLISSNTRAILVVHLYGLSADIDEFKEIASSNGIALIEDCAQALGAEYGGRKVGTFGTASAFSFFPTKNLGALGDGGLVATDDVEIAERVRMLRVHGSRKKYMHELMGFNSRLDEIQAAVLRVKLKHLDRWNGERMEIASKYDKVLKSVVTPFVPAGRTHVYHQYTIRAKNRDILINRLDQYRTGSAVYYPVPLHLQPCFEDLGYRAGDLPESETASCEVISLPMFPGLMEHEIERVADIMNEAIPNT